MKPTNFGITIELEAEGGGLATARTEYQHWVEKAQAALAPFGMKVSDSMNMMLLRRTGPSQYVVLNGSNPADAELPNATYKVTGKHWIDGLKTKENVAQAIKALYATGLNGRATISYSIDPIEDARLLALKAAVAQGMKRVQVMQEAANPQKFMLIYIKEAEFQPPNVQMSTSLDNKEPFTPLNTIEVSTNVTLFYGLQITGTAPKSVAVATPAAGKPAKKH